MSDEQRHTAISHAALSLSTTSFHQWDFKDPHLLVCYHNFLHLYSSRSPHLHTKATTASLNRYLSLNMCAKLQTRYDSCPHIQSKSKGIMAARAKECAKCAMEVSEDFKETLDSVKVVEEPQVKRRRLQKKRRGADQAPELAPQVEVENASEAALESWPAGEMNELVLPGEQAEEEHAERGVARQHDHDWDE